MALSDWDKKHLNSQQQRAVITYTQQYDAAIKEGNKDKARMAHEGAEAIRRQAGYSGGDAGNSFLPAAQTTTKTTSTTKNGKTTYQTT